MDKILDSRIATRHAFEARIRISVLRNGSEYFVDGWARDLSESGLAAFVAHHLLPGEKALLEIPLSESKRLVMEGRVARSLGTEYGFEFTAVSAAQRHLLRSALQRRPVIPQPTKVKS